MRNELERNSIIPLRVSCSYVGTSVHAGLVVPASSRSAICICETNSAARLDDTNSEERTQSGSP